MSSIVMRLALVKRVGRLEHSIRLAVIVSTAFEQSWAIIVSHPFANNFSFVVGFAIQVTHVCLGSQLLAISVGMVGSGEFNLSFAIVGRLSLPTCGERLGTLAIVKSHALV